MAGSVGRVPDIAKLPPVFFGIAYTTALNLYWLQMNVWSVERNLFAWRGRFWILMDPREV